MYNFKPHTERIERLRQRVRDRLIISDASKLHIKMQAQAKYKNFPPLIQKPMISLYIIQNMHIDIDEDEFFVGDLGNKHWGASGGQGWLWVDIENTWPIEADGLHHAPDEDPFYSHQKLAISPEDLAELRRLSDIQRESFEGIRPEEWLPDNYNELFSLEACTYGRPGMWPVLLMPGHLTPGFQNILAKGYGAIRKEAQDFMDEHLGNCQGDDMDKYMFYKAATVACDGAITLTRRYADLAREKAKTAKTPEKKAEYEKMAVSLDWIATEPARTFWEACQQVMLYHVFLKIDNDPGVTSMGRFDQYTWPYLKKDLEASSITIDEAQEYVDAFFLKLNLFYGGGFGKSAQTAGVGHIGQHTTLGGVIPETGEDATNPVTYMVLETEARLQLHEPTVSLRTTEKTPADLWDLALSTSMKVGGLPLLQNDNVIIPGLMRELGFSLEDARNYAFIGCQEIVGSGNDYPAPNGQAMGHNGTYWPIALVMAVNDGINPMNGKQAPERVRCGTLADMKSFDEVKAALEKMVGWMLTWSATLNNYAEHEQTRLFPFPNLSISTTGCMEKGKDVSAGGAKYNSYGGVATGLATVSDSLTAIKYMVFDKKYVTGKEFLDAILANWEGYESLRQRVINECPHYGNGDPYADAQHTYVLDLYYNITRPFHTPRAKVYKCGMFGASDHVAQGEITWATFDGRRTGEPIADAMSPVQGRDVNGPTSVFCSSVCFDHSRYLDGMAVNLRIHPSALQGDGLNKLRDMTQAYFQTGGMECQYNVVDAETLRAAQEHPEEYHNLVVRIAGYSAYFVDMTEAMQNDIISRAEHKF